MWRDHLWLGHVLAYSPDSALPPGALVPAANAVLTSDAPGEIISAGVALALPYDEDQNGLIMEYSAKGDRPKIEETVRNMAVVGMKLRGWGGDVGTRGHDLHGIHCPP